MTVSEAWDALFQVIDTLTQAGMSSDESDVDDMNRLIYLVKKRVWRNKAFTNLLKIVDADASTTNAYGNR